jgi:hypothetical protein
MSDFKGWPGNETVFIVPIVITAVSFVAVVLRFISRTLVRRRITVDDWLILLAWVSGTLSEYSRLIQFTDLANF